MVCSCARPVTDRARVHAAEATPRPLVRGRKLLSDDWRSAAVGHGIRAVPRCSRPARGADSGRSDGDAGDGVPGRVARGGPAVMKLFRRDFMRAGGVAATGAVLPWLETGCIRNRPQPRLIASRAPLPRPFEAQLPRPPVLKPARTD